MSRRLGRPSKKKEGEEGRPQKRAKTAASAPVPSGKRKLAEKVPAVNESSPKRKIEEAVDEISIEDSLLTPSLTDVLDQAGSFPGKDVSWHLISAENNNPVPEEVDFSSDTWLQDIMAGQSTETQERNFFDSLDSLSKLDNLPSTTGYKDQGIFESLPPSFFGNEQQSPPPGYFSPPLSNSNMQSHHDPDLDFRTTPPATSKLMYTPTTTYAECPKKNPFLSDLPQDTFLPSATMSEQQDLLSHAVRGPERTFNFDHHLSQDTLNLVDTASLDTTSSDSQFQCQCQCYEQAIRELVRVNICASRAGPSSIDTILTCQRGLQKLAETVLQCAVCSKTRVNLLMVIIVSIDSLLSTLEAATASAQFGSYDPLSDDEGGYDVLLSGGGGRRHRDTTGFKAQVEACPLVVGSFRIPLDEKYLFVKQLLHTRLSGLLGTIRRIRLCTQQIMATSSSRGRLIMMMETDRRLQLIMMKIKMFCW